MTPEPVTLTIPPEIVSTIAAEAARLVLAELQAEQNTPEVRSPYLTIREAAEFLRCSRQRVDDLLSQGRLTRYKDGSRTLVSRVEVEEHLRHEERRA